MKNGYMKLSGYGPGGRNCVCCGPSPAYRKKHDRKIKKRERFAIKIKLRGE